MTKRIIIGLGSGRSGTASLAHLINRQPNAICFHELNPSSVRFAGTLKPIVNTVEEFSAILNGGDPSLLTVDMTRRPSVETYEELQKIKSVKFIGDIGHYYLRYVENLMALQLPISFVCLKRDKEETVQSWMAKTRVVRWPSKIISDRLASLIMRTPYQKSAHHWIEHDGTKWRHDPVWDKCFPNFPAETKEDSIRLYWDYYYEEAERLATLFPDTFRIFETTSMNDESGRSDLLSFCHIPEQEQANLDSWIHQSKA